MGDARLPRIGEAIADGTAGSAQGCSSESVTTRILNHKRKTVRRAESVGRVMRDLKLKNAGEACRHRLLLSLEPRGTGDGVRTIRRQPQYVLAVPVHQPARPIPFRARLLTLLKSLNDIWANKGVVPTAISTNKIRSHAFSR